jgi:hypothetical protein
VKEKAAETAATLSKTQVKLRSLEEEHAKLDHAHREAVQEAVGARMAMRKSEEQLSSKMAEAAAEANRAAEARLLETLKRDYNESSLKSVLPSHIFLARRGLRRR